MYVEHDVWNLQMCFEMNGLRLGFGVCGLGVYACCSLGFMLVVRV
jgi:hypothetical protein